MKLRTWALVVVLVSLSGCAYTRDITPCMANYRPGPVRRGDPDRARDGYRALVGDYRAGAVYRLMATARISDVKGRDVTETYYFDPDVPRYYLEPPDGPGIGAVVGQLPAGTLLRFEKLIYHNYVADEMTYPFAVVLSGPNAGMRVCLARVSIHDRVSTPEVLEDRYLQDRRWLQAAP